jgi:hypothetical protein
MELENIYMLSVGQLRELLAYACAEESVDSWWEDITEDDLERVGFYDELDADEDDDDYDEDTDYDEDDELFDDEDEDDWDEDEDYDDEEEEDPEYLDEDEVCVGGALPIPEEEEIAQSIAADIRNGRYGIEVVRYLYNDSIIDRIYELI